MVMLEVYTKCIKVKYKAFLLSKATFITLSFNLIAVILPFILCYETGGLWKKRDVVYQQPEIKFMGDFLFLATASDNQNPVICSSFSFYNNYVKSLDTCAIIKVRESDTNLDGKVDSLYVLISAKLPKNFKLTSLYLILPLNYSIQIPCIFHTQSAIIYQQIIVNSVSKVSVYADLGLKQSESLRCSKNGIAINIERPIIDEHGDFQSYSLDTIIAKYAESKIKTTINNVLTTINPINDDGTFTISLAVKYPEHKIRFKPNLWQIVKFAWIQYIAIYLVTSWIIFQIKSYIFKNNLVLLYEDRTNRNK